MSEAGINAYVDFFQRLSRERLAALDDVTTEDVHFRDPFNDVRGREAMRRVLAAMFDDVAEPQFRVTHRARDGATWFLRWRFTGRLRRLGGRDWSVTGMSEIHLAPDGRVAEHIDHWDAGRGFYEMIPVLGALLRFLRRRIEVD